MKPLEIISALPQWTKATPGEIVDSPAFAMPCRLGDENATLRHAEVLPAESETLALAVAFGDEPHAICLARSPRFPELDKIWDSRADVPDAILLALVERECGPLFQLLENAVRKQLRLVGLGKGGIEAPSAFLALCVSASLREADSADGIVFTLSRSDTVVSAFGALRNLDLAHESVRSLVLPASGEYAAFAMSAADLSVLEPGDALLLPEIGEASPRLVVDGRFVIDESGVVPLPTDALVRVRDAEARTVTLGEVFDAAETPAAPGSVSAGAPLCLVRGDRPFARGRLDRLGDQNVFVVEENVK